MYSRRIYYTGIVFLIAGLIFISCSGQEIRNGVKIVSNDAPKYSPSEYVKLEKVNAIKLISDKYEIARVFGMTTDNENNLYVLDDGSRVNVFDNNGNFLRVMGGRGQGPEELATPETIDFFDEKFFIYERFSGIKILDTFGNYLDKIRTPPGNHGKIIPNEKGFKVLSSRKNTDNIEIRDWILSDYSRDFSDKDNLFKAEQHTKTEFFAAPQFLLAVGKNGEFYYPESSQGYSIIGYHENGEAFIKFGRTFESVPYSQKTKEHLVNKYKFYVDAGFFKKIPDSPPVIRKIMLDSRNNIWVVSGELHIEQPIDHITDNEISIFDKEGKWLQSFNLKGVSEFSILRNGYFYNVSKVSQSDAQQYIDVYRINYKF